MFAQTLPSKLRGRASASIRSRRPLTVRAQTVTPSFPTNPFVTGSTALTVFNTEEQPVPMAELTRGKTVLALLRHFGCPLCWEQLHLLQTQIPKFEQHGYRLVVIGVGSGLSALKVCEKTGFPSSMIFGDPSREVYRVLALENGIDKTFASMATPLALLNRGLDGLKEGTRNYVPIPPRRPDDVFQQGGLFIFEDGVTAYGWSDQGTGDHAPLGDVLNVCCGAA